MKHVVIRWNPGTKEWFCTKCGRTSDLIKEDDARVKLDQHDCQVPSQGTSTPPGTKTLRLIRKRYKMAPKAESVVRDPVGIGALTEEDNEKK